MSAPRAAAQLFRIDGATRSFVPPATTRVGTAQRAVPTIALNTDTVSTVGCQWRMARAPAAVGAKEKIGLDRCVLSSLAGLILCSRHNPAINRWAIFERPCGTWNRDTLNTYNWK